MSIFHPVLTPDWQEVLLLALEGDSDAEIAATLELSLHAVKKRWSGLYQHLAERAAQPSLAPWGSGAEAFHPQKRRYLLPYLRQHPEELRPLPPPRKGKHT